MEAPSLKPPFPEFLATFLRPVVPDPVAYAVIEAAGDNESRAQSLAPLLNSDAGYRNFLFAQTFLSDRMSAWELENAEVPERNSIMLERILGLLGKFPVRNLIACASLDRLAGVPEPTTTETKIVARPAQAIPFALEAERICQDKSWLLPEAAFIAGLHYDWLAAIIKKRNGPPEEKSALDAAFKEGLMTAKMAYELGERVKEIKLGKYLFASGLLLPIGKAMMMCLFPSSLGTRGWAYFMSDYEQAAERKFEFLNLMESRRFAVSHAELAALFINFGGLLRKIEKAVCHYPYPNRLGRSDPDLCALSTLLSLATRMARSLGTPFAREPFQEKWMAANQITESVLKIAALAATR